MNTVMVIGGLPESLINFRGDLIDSLVARSDRVVAMSAPATEEIRLALKHKGAEFCAFDIRRNGLNPLSDFKILMQLIGMFRKVKPEVALAYTIKPVIWGGLAARFTRTDFVALITGLGYAFQGEGFKRRCLTWLVRKLYSVSLRSAKVVLFQNKDNAELFIRLGIIEEERICIVNGSGVNIEHYDVVPIPALAPKQLNFLCVARLLKEKGLFEYAAAAQIVKQCYPEAKFRLVGPLDPSPDAISLKDVETWTAIDYLGEKKDVRPDLADCHVYVLPSYHEGLPRSSLEAMSIGRPLITTNAVGCRETVIEGWNGFQVDVGSAQQLADKMIWMIENQDKSEEMGINSRKMVEEKFDVRIVNKQILKAMGIGE